MQPSIQDTLHNLKLGEVTTSGLMSVIPIYLGHSPEYDYTTLPGVTSQGSVKISELPDGATVPELLINNDSDQNVMLIDGDEVIGSKQNRALNATVVVQAHTEMHIPVSCTESGRWSRYYESSQDSGFVMPFTVRCSKKMTVDRNLKERGVYESEQNEVWDKIGMMRERAQAPSHTDAMRDIYRSFENTLDDITNVFSKEPGQTGVVVMIGGEVAGIELFSRDTAYSSMAERILKGYAIEEAISCEMPQVTPTRETAFKFLETVQSMNPEVYPSVGVGDDYRFQGDGVTGTALVCEGEMVFAAFHNSDLAERISA